MACGQRHGVGGIVRHQLAELVDLPVGHLQHAADVAQHGARLQFPVRDDLRHAVGAVLLLHVADHLVAAVLAEVDVEVGHRHALGVQEPLEQQAEAQGIEVGDGERPGHDRAGARAAARPHGNAAGLGPLDEVGNDQEVAGKPHLRDHADLEREAPLVVLRREARRRRAGRQPRREAGLGLRGQLRGLEPQQLLLARARRGGDEARQDRLAPPRPEGAALGDLDGVRQGLRQVGEQLRHLLRGLEEMLARQAPPVVLRDVVAAGDAQQRVVRLVVVGRCEVDLVGGHDRQRAGVGELEQHRLGLDLVLEAVTLDLDVEPVAENLLERLRDARTPPPSAPRAALCRWARPVRP